MSANEPGQPPSSNGHLGHNEWTRNLHAPSVVLAIGAHPDDIEFGCGGTLAKWAATGAVIHHVVLTDGSKGTWNVDADTSHLVDRRQHEQREAAHRLGATGEVRFLRAVDGELTHDSSVVDAVALTIRQLTPDVVLGHDPWKRYRLHPDHRNAGLITCDAIVAARDPHFLRHHMSTHGVSHHRPAALLLWEADEPNHMEDVSDWVDEKLAALEAHESQFESTMKTKDGDLTEFRHRIRERLAGLGEPHGVAAAEIFHLIDRL